MHRSFAWVLLGSALGLSAATALAGPGEPVNLLSNAGFEEGLAGWSPDPQHVLVNDKSQAHSGTACLSGEVSAPSRALTLRRQVPVKAGNRYLFEVWARATKGTKLVLWVVPPGSEQRVNVAAWEKVTPKWQRYQAPLDVEQDGRLELQIIAPSSHRAPPGKIWIDDLAVYETEMPKLVSASGDVGFNDEPALARAADGSLYVAWLSFRAGDDSLQVARFQPQGGAMAPAGRWQVLGGKGCYVLGPRLAPAGDQVALVYARERDRTWDIEAVFCGPGGPGQPIVVGASPAVDVDPAAAWREGTLWIAWESNRNRCRQVLAASVVEGKPSEAVPVSEPGVSACDPSIAVLANGEVCVAWHAFRHNNYDVCLRRRAAGGAWGTETRLTKAPTIDRHAELIARGDELWLVYENATTDKYHIGRTNFRRLVVAKVAAEGLLAPKLSQATSPLDERCEAAAAAFDTEGRLWMAFLKPRLPRAGWDTFLTCLTGDRWIAPIPVSTQKGMDRRPGLVLDQGRAIVAMQCDNIPNSWGDVDQTASARSNVFLAECRVDGVPAAAATFEPLAENAEPFEPAEIRVARGEDSPTPSITYQGRTLRLFYGDFHEHSDVSVCNRCGDQSVDESYQHMRDLAVHDFACTTDHCYNFNPYLWGYTAKLARVNDDPQRFLTFLAEEWTSSFEEYDTKHPYGFYGHRNLILADTYFPRWWNSRNRQTPAQVWEELGKMGANFIHIPHQLADTGNVPTDWDFANEKAQPVAEIFQTRGSYECEGAPRQAKNATPKPGYFLQDAWARGIVIGVIASPDHGGGYGKACVFAPELTREAILDAVRARHCYGTTAAKIFLDVRVEGRLMGEKVREPAGKSVTVEVRTRCPVEIDRVEVCRNNRFIYCRNPSGTQCEFQFVDREPLPDRSYYYVRVIQKDEEIAWSSPVWFGAP